MAEPVSGIRFVLFEDIPEKDDVPEAYLDIHEYLSGHKLLGCANWVQSASEDGESKLLLLQLEADDTAGIDWGEAGLGYYLIHDLDLRHSRFDAAVFELQTT